MENKKKYLAILTSFTSVEGGVFYVNRKTFEKISNNFDKIFVINSQNLRFFPKFSRSIYQEKNFNKINCVPVDMPKNFILFNPKNSKEFSNFLDDKELIIINHINKHFFDLKVQMLIKKHKLKQVQISTLGVEGAPTEKTSREPKHILKSILKN